VRLVTHHPNSTMQVALALGLFRCQAVDKLCQAPKFSLLPLRVRFDSGL